MRAVEKYDVNVIGLTLSENQHAHVEKLFAESDSPRSKRVLLNGWEQFDEPVDRIVSIGAFEHFGFDRYDDFFKMAYRVLPDDGVMLLHTIMRHVDGVRQGQRHPADDGARAVRQVHHDRDLPRRAAAARPRWSSELAAAAGFTRRPGRSRCSRTTPARWTSGPTALEARRDEAIAIQSEEVYDRYMQYLTGCAELFQQG